MLIHLTKHIPGVKCINKDTLTNIALYVSKSYNIEGWVNMLFDTNIYSVITPYDTMGSSSYTSQQII